ncbi:(4Fe-4S)-binding protein [Streptomyces sp. NPDC001941]|uniref:(4Fe-4S)-binding protein n=1 Tax=Streptomyces sp. NPDC001941 TaxID=3154659 RepID=UPI0033268011
MPEQPEKPPVREYAGRLVSVTFEARRCLHAAECVGGLPQVFDLAKRPWIQPDGAPADLVADVVRRCPSGALRYRLADGEGGKGEDPAVPTTVARDAAGALTVRGDLSVETGEGVRREVRAVLCGCGASGNQPFCDHAGACGAG